MTQCVPDYRKRRADELLARCKNATVEDMQAIQYDVVSLQARDLLEVFLPCLPDGPITRTRRTRIPGVWPVALQKTTK